MTLYVYFDHQRESSSNTLTPPEKADIWVPRVVFFNTADNEVSKAMSNNSAVMARRRVDKNF